jgi:hypothetical protein
MFMKYSVFNKIPFIYKINKKSVTYVDIYDAVFYLIFYLNSGINPKIGWHLLVWGLQP